MTAVFVAFVASQALFAEEDVIFQQDFESDVVGEGPSGRWTIHARTGASCLVSDEATTVPGSPPGSKNLKFAKTQTGGDTQLTVQLSFEEHVEKVMTSGRLTATYWVYFESGALMRHVVFRGYNPYKHYMRMVVRGEWPEDVRLEFPINGAQVQVTDTSWHKLTFMMEWDPVWPLPEGGIPRSQVSCRFFVDDQEHPGSPANISEDLVSPFGSIEFNTADNLTAVCHLDNVTVSVAPPPPAITSLHFAEGKLAMQWSDPMQQIETPYLYRAEDPRGPWKLFQGNIESTCLVSRGETAKLFCRVGQKETPSATRMEIFLDDFEGYANSAEVENVGGWRVVNGSGFAEVTWRLWNTAGEPLNVEDPNLVGMSGNYMISDSDFSAEAHVEEQLISPEIDCSGFSDVWVGFNCNIRIYEDDAENPQITELDISVYDADSGTWSEWANLFRRTAASGDWSSEEPKVFNLSPAADGRKVKIRWRFHQAQYDYWWAIDNVGVSGEQL